uniref:Uncharacterized protein n=1 Tax=Anguilla anguilla TaxID=7936 RepID=A0A0E9PL01_ANGAN
MGDIVVRGVTLPGTPGSVFHTIV